LEFCTKGGALPKIQRDREAGEKTNLLTEGEEEPGEVAGGSSEMVAAGGGSSPAGGEEIARSRGQRELAVRSVPLARLRAGGLFKNAIWAHRTVYSACPVHTGQRTVAVR
jgi:hypothetical protein